MCKTESHNRSSFQLDTVGPGRAAHVLLHGQLEAAKKSGEVLIELVGAAALAAAALHSGGRLIYIGAGSSGLMALADALELPVTFGLDRDRIRVVFPLGVGALLDLDNEAEEDGLKGVRDIDDMKVRDGDCIVAISAGGHTPFTVNATRRGRDCGARIVVISNNVEASLFEYADVQIYLNTPSEIVAGSTRMGAGTAQKIALNIFSTLVGIHLGHVHDGYMVNIRADNEKLRQRASKIVSEIADVELVQARAALEASNGCVKLAVLLASGLDDLTKAKLVLHENDHNLRRALQAFSQF